MTPDLLPGGRWCRSCQRPESEVRFCRHYGFICAECCAAARALNWYWKRSWRNRQKAQARAQVREVAAA